MRLSPLLMQLLMGTSISRYLPATGTAGLARSWVSGNRRAPWPPPRMRLRTERCCMAGAFEGVDRDDATRPPRPGKGTSPGEPTSAADITGHAAGEKDGLFGAIVKGHPVVGVPADEQAGVGGDAGLNALNALQVPDQVLRDGGRPPRDLNEGRRRRDAHRQPQFGP